MQFHFRANQSHFPKNGFALRLALKQRHKETWKWPIGEPRWRSNESAPPPPMWPGFDSCPNTWVEFVVGFSGALRVFLRFFQLSLHKNKQSIFQFDQDRCPAWKPAKADVASSLKISFTVRHKAVSQVLIAQIMHKNSRSVYESRYLGTPIWPSKKFFRDEWRHLHVHPCVSFRVLRNIADFEDVEAAYCRL